MKFANSAHIRVFLKENEEAARISDGLKIVAPFDYEKEKIKFQQQTATGFNEAKIRIFSITLEKERHISTFLKQLFGKLTGEQKSMLSRQKESRLDEELNFYIRLDKDKMNDGEFWITDSGNCYHITISIAAFPRKREVALEAVEKMLKICT